VEVGMKIIPIPIGPQPTATTAAQSRILPAVVVATLSDPVSFNSALHNAHGQTILTSGASQGTQSGRALDAGRGVYPVFMIGGRMRSFVCPIEGTRWYSLPSSPEILPRSTAMARVALRRLSLPQRRLASMFQARQ
jgi:hypothetical protein